ncbi:hypothetical protein GE061_016642 [Apolygus lucorum]|uniref:Uncharacterized protein n=1 Tax=Apolygus lucorum TaxID=248454 RepID=A0A6A4IV69_APOLU|nr:hypothetical protein GE061_016642 [Apolygus lucorum]
MIWCLFLVFTPIVSAFVPGLGYNALVGGGIYPGGVPLYSGYIAKPVVYGQQVVDGANFYGGGQGYKNYEHDGVAREVLRDNNVLVNKGAQGIAGGHMVVKGNEGNQGYYSDALGAKYNQEGKGLAGAAKQYGSSGEDGYDGFGSAGHRKGHRTSGFHKTYHNVESGKDTKYVDEDHDVAAEKFGQAYDSAFDDKAYNAHGHGHGEGLYAEKVAEGAAARGGIKSAGAHDMSYDALNHNGYYKDRDMAYRNGQAMMQKGGAGGYGANGMRGAAGAQMYQGPMW